MAADRDVAAARKRDDFWYSLGVSPKDLKNPVECDHPHGFESMIGGSCGPAARGCADCGWLAAWGRE